MAGMISIGVGPETHHPAAPRFNGCAFRAQVHEDPGDGGTRFVGRPLVARLQAQGHALTLFTRGKNPVPAGVEHVCGDRSSDEGLSALQGRSFDVIVDSSGRKQEDSSRVVDITGAPSHRFVYEFGRGLCRLRSVALG